MATLPYDVTKPQALLVALAASKLQEALDTFKRVARNALATADVAGDPAQDAAWASIEGASSEYGVVASGNAGEKGHAWFTAVDTLSNLADEAKDALEKLDVGA